MNWASQVTQTLWNSNATREIGWVLMHSVWQGAVVAGALAVALGALRRRSAAAGYALACLALVAMVAWPVATIALRFATPVEKASHSVAFATGGPVNPRAPTTLAPGITTSSAAPHLTFADLLSGVTCAWIAGVGLLAAWNLFGWRQVRRLRYSSPAAPGNLQQTLDRLRAKMSVSREITIRICSQIGAPAVIGVLRPVVLVPASALTELSPDHLQALLLHELAHVKRHDYLVNLFQTAAETLLFYHPAAWWISSVIRRERENCCDDLAARHCGSAMLFARALAAMEEIRACGTPGFALGVMGNGRLIQRIQRLVGAPVAPKRRGASPFVAAVGMAVLAALVTISAKPSTSRAQVKTPSAATPATTPSVVNTVAPEYLEAKPATDYQITPNDMLAITLSDLNGPNTETIKQLRVTESGSISLPFLTDPIHAGGLTEIGLEQAIVKAYRDARLIEHANVSVTVIEARGRSFNIIGAVTTPGAYQILKSNFRLLDAIAMAHGTLPSASISVIRVMRAQPSRPLEPHNGQITFEGELQVIEIPAAKLLGGDASVNMVIRPNDTIVIASDAAAGPAQPVVRLVVGAGGLNFQGKPTTWDQLNALLGELPERRETVLEITADSDELPVGKYFDAHARASELVSRWGLKNLTQVSIGKK